MSKSLPYAKKPGKQDKSSQGQETRGSESSHKSDPRQPVAYGANCPDCGSIGSYLDSGDAQRAEQLHQQRVHSNSPGKRTLPVAAQQKANKHGKRG